MFPQPGLHDVFYLILLYLAPKYPDGPNFVDETPNSRSARRDLACLARSHTSFTRPALAVLWRSLPSQKPLEHLLCTVGIAQRSPGSERDGRSLEMRRTPATHRAGWVRFQEYASLVRKIVLDPLTDDPCMPADRLQDTFWSQLSSFSHPQPVLPRLERAAIRNAKIPRYTVDDGVLCLLSSSIRELDIRLVFPQATLLPREPTPLEKALATCIASIKSLEVLSIDVPNLALVVDLESLPRSHPRLRYLKLINGASSIEPSLRPLAALPNLKYLHTNLCRSERVAVPIRGPITIAGLRTLAVSCYEVSAISSLLDRVKAPRLSTFSVCKMYRDRNHAGPLAAQELSRYLRTLVAKCPSLIAFEWRTKSTPVDPTTTRRVGNLGRRRSEASLAEFFAPLLSHRTMRGFSVQSSAGGPAVPFTLADFRAIAEAWPDLETLHLHDQDDNDYGDSKGVGSSASTGTGRRWERAPRCAADLECVFALARGCPRLRVLHIGKMEFVSGAFGSNLARCPPEPHPALRELCVDHVVCAGAGEQRRQPQLRVRLGEDGDGEVRRRKVIMQLRYLMVEAFPFAAIRVGGWNQLEDNDLVGAGL